MRERDIVWVELAGKMRPAVVIEIAEDLIRVAYGTTAEQAMNDRVVVHPSSLQGRRFGLTVATSFVGPNTAWAATGEMRETGEKCSSELFFAIRAVVDLYDSSIEPGAG